MLIQIPNPVQAGKINSPHQNQAGSEHHLGDLEFNLVLTLSTRKLYQISQVKDSVPSDFIVSAAFKGSCKPRLHLWFQ